MSCQNCSRRQAIKSGVNLAAGLALSSSLIGALSGCGAPASTDPASSSNPGANVPNNSSNQYTFDFATYPQLQSVGGSVIATIQAGSGAKTVSIVRTGSGSVTAVSVVCTHAGCQINGYDSGSQSYSCPCHGSVFSSSGSVLVGPASSPLPTYSSIVTGSGVQVTMA